ncbi:hypothetical protein MCOR25_010191 [Pyricularia grisea]|nr:hypothetical protein MCOR25_010191 [Pyricularia grisea]
MRPSDLVPRRFTNQTNRQLETRLNTPYCDLPWYHKWLRRQVRAQPQGLLFYPPEENLDDDSALDAHFLPLWCRIRALILQPGPTSIDAISNALVLENLVILKQDYDAMQSVRDLVFSVLGWQTMLYKPDFSSYSSGGYTLLDEMDGCNSESRVCLNQHGLSSRNNLSDFLLGFGMMLPPRNHCAMPDPDDQLLFSRTKTILVKDVDAHVLTKVCSIKIQWVDSLSCHLELNRQSGILYVFRYPSFCLSALKEYRSQTRSERAGGGGDGSVLHRCGLMHHSDAGVPWGSEEDVTALLAEIILSYRLIFGQSKRSRATFRRLRPFTKIPPAEHDKVLWQLCGRKRPELLLHSGDGGVVDLVERDEYDLAGDFPHLRSRLTRLSAHAASRKPRSIRQLWQDNRDSTAWLAFWSVLIFGSVSVVLGLTQTVFQILSYFNDIKDNEKG